MKKLLFVFSIIFCTSIAVAEDSGGRAKDFINNVSARVIETIENGGDDSAKETKLTNIFVEVMDIDWIGKYTLGRYWNSLSDSEKVQYLKTYRQYLIASYVPLFKKYNGQKQFIKDEKDIGNDQYIVVTTISNDDQNTKPYNVEYRIKFNDNKFKVRDIIAEGVSLLSTQRSDFSSIMGQGGIQELINQLNRKVSG